MPITGIFIILLKNTEAPMYRSYITAMILFCFMLNGHMCT